MSHFVQLSRRFGSINAAIVATFFGLSLAGGDCSGGSAPGMQGLGYAFDRPDTVFVLPRSLREVSGLTSVGDTLLGAVEDENGVFYLIDPATGTTADRIKVASDADYEGVETVGSRLFMLRSNGNLVHVPDWTSENDGEVIKTPLKSKNDTEGLTYDPAEGRLLIACKEDPGNDSGPGNRAIYEFDLADNALNPEPVYMITAASVRRFFADSSALSLRIRRATGTFGFKPSALAIDPGNGDLYVLSSVWKGLVVLNPGGDVTHVVPLPDKLFRQPEGLAFIGHDLWVADEGAGGRGRLFKYSPSVQHP